MRLALLAAAGVLAAAAPAMANEARLEIHSGVIWNHDSNDATIGAAAGYDYDLNKLAFVGAEVSADKILAGVYNRVDFGFTGRAGVKINNSKLYGLAGYSTTPCRGCGGCWQFGGGVQQNLFKNFYGKIEYRHYIGDETLKADGLTAGFGVKF